MKKAKYWDRKDTGAVQCFICPNECVIKPGKEGICKQRQNVGGELLAHRYGEVSAIAMDPIEKKPLYHFYPGSQILSVGTVGCNFACDFCQNYHLVEAAVPTEEVTPEQLIQSARAHRSIGIAYTYNEPLHQLRVRDGLCGTREKSRPEKCAGDQRLLQPGAV